MTCYDALGALLWLEPALQPVDISPALRHRKICVHFLPLVTAWFKLAPALQFVFMSCTDAGACRRWLTAECGLIQAGCRVLNSSQCELLVVSLELPAPHVLGALKRVG